MQPASAEDLAHFADVMAMLKERWSAMPAEVSEKMKSMGGTSSAEEAKAEFMATWAASDTDADGMLNQAEFRDFTQKQLGNMNAKLGWTPEYSEEVADKIFASIHALDSSKAGIDMMSYGRYGACMKTLQEQQ